MTAADFDSVRYDPTGSTNTGSKESLEKVLFWCRDCIENHTTCKEWPHGNQLGEGLPTRLLTCSIGADDDVVKLVLAKELPRETRYMTLSHCWGGQSTIRLTRNNIDYFKRGISLERLPQTFRDAFAVTNSLGVAYLWIDALCIIQDSLADWEEEAGRMAQVYANSFLNISADASSDSRGGLFRNRDPTSFSASFIPFTRPGSDYHGFCCYHDDWKYAVDNAPLNQRAWVLQERFLAPRVVHFAEDQIHWECCSCMTSESLPGNLNLNYWNQPVFKSFVWDHRCDYEVERDQISIIKAWEKMMNRYANCKIRFATDRQVAIAGLARAFCNYLRLEPSDYVCGLWRSTFIWNLGWRCDRSLSRSSDKILLNTGIPSWSWLSYDAPTYQISTGLRTRVAELLDVKTTPVANPFGPITSGFAKFRAPICLAAISLGWSGQCIYQIKHHVFEEKHGVRLIPDGAYGQAFLQDKGNSVYVFLLGVGPRISRLGRDTERLLPDDIVHACCLLLRPTSVQEEFSRIGLLYLSREDGADVPKFEKFCMLLEDQFRSESVPEHLENAVGDEIFHAVTLV